ncbi:hypothetical protein QWY15_13315 [Planococcus sp. N064]|uniref:Uncharacterized protein n=1 Tax=Planococcus liqunii TaxID=3058394 RepID=A0ABT8MTP3_9BACL|nr:hypothetical protein [Planococcus sp. N064]MDN7228277.1 hypothetical protein [Planococcus sp. N064]
MKLFFKFSFWLPFFSFMLILFELLVQPAKPLVWMGLDPVFDFIRSLLPDIMDTLPSLLLLHFLLALLYGFTLDALIKKINEAQGNE